MHNDYLSGVLGAPFRGNPFSGLSLAPSRLELCQRNFQISLKENVEEIQRFLGELGLSPGRVFISRKICIEGEYTDRSVNTTQCTAGSMFTQWTHPGSWHQTKQHVAEPLSRPVTQQTGLGLVGLKAELRYCYFYRADDLGIF